MNEPIYSQLKQLKQSQGSTATIDQLIATLRTAKDFDRLFDALLMKKRHEMGLPLVRPTSFDDVPDEQREEFEESYIAAAREVGELHLQEGAIPQAWVYLRTIGEPQKVADAINALESIEELQDELIDIALYQGVCPAKGLEILLASHGTCNSVTAMDQQFPQMQLDARQRCAALLVRVLYDELVQTIRHEVQRKQDFAPSGKTLRELIAGRDWLFADNNYHIDVSHLHSVVHFSRVLDSASEEFQLARQLAEYGSHLSPQFQYPGEGPFDDFYQAHIQYFKALDNDEPDEAIAYFKAKLGEETNDPDVQFVAYNLVELMMRIGQTDQALGIASKYLVEAQDQLNFSFPQLCAQAGRFDTLMKVSRDKGDLIHYTAALLHGAAEVTRT